MRPTHNGTLYHAREAIDSVFNYPCINWWWSLELQQQQQPVASNALKANKFARDFVSPTTECWTPHSLYTVHGTRFGIRTRAHRFVVHSYAVRRRFHRLLLLRRQKSLFKSNQYTASACAFHFIFFLSFSVCELLGHRSVCACVRRSANRAGCRTRVTANWQYSAGSAQIDGVSEHCALNLNE